MGSVFSPWIIGRGRRPASPPPHHWPNGSFRYELWL